MSSGRIQLTTVGVQDALLTENPEITFFQKRFKRHANFAVEVIDSLFDDVSIWGKESRCTLQRQGDLINGIWFRIDLPEIGVGSFKYTSTVLKALIEHVDLNIGGRVIQRISGEFMDLVDEITIPEDRQRSLLLNEGKRDTRNGLPIAEAPYYPATYATNLSFYFRSSTSLAIPLVAIDKQEIEIIVKLRDFESVTISEDPTDIAFLPLTPPKIEKTSIIVEYIFITDEEAQFFRANQLDYLITQTQMSQISIPASLNSAKFRLNFVNSVKELFFVVQSNLYTESNIITGNDWFNYTNPSDPSGHHLKSLSLDLNGERIIHESVADHLFLHSIQPLKYHTRSPSSRQFYMYSFALQPENHEPTGQINLSRIQNQLLNMNFYPSTYDRNIRIYAINYNVLRVKHGIAGLLFIDNNHY